MKALISMMFSSDAHIGHVGLSARYLISITSWNKIHVIN